MKHSALSGLRLFVIIGVGWANIANAAGASVPESTLQKSVLDDTLAKERTKLDGKASTEAKAAEKIAPAPKEASPKETTAADLPLPARRGRLEEPVNAKYLPKINMAPASSISAWLGQTLKLQGQVAPNSSAIKSHVAWILNGKVVCRDVECSIPLDGKIASVGFSSVVFLTYNAYGSSMTRHAINVFKGNWKPSSPIDPKFIKIEKMVPAVPEDVKLDKNAFYLWAPEGNAVQAYPETVLVLGGIARNISWEGQLKTGARSLLRMIDNSIAKWFVLSGSDITFDSKSKLSKISNLLVSRGSVRVQSVQKTPEKGAPRGYRNDITLSTKEVSLYVDPGVDAVITRQPPPLLAFRKRKTVKALSALTHEEQFVSKVVVLGGVARFKAKKPDGTESPITELPPGIELTVFEDGLVAPLERPKPERMEAILKQTLLPEEVAERARKKAEAAKIKIDIVEELKKVTELAEREDYFEMLNELALVEDRKAEDARIPYFFGVAYKGLYQPLEAEKYFLEASNQDLSYADPYWQLSMMYLDDKKWPEAAEYLDKAYSRLSAGDKRLGEYRYYAGVSSFNLNADFVARNNFMRALLWESTLDASLKASAGDFFKKLRERKPWNLVVPLGLQWDGNALDLPTTATLPATYTQKYLYRFMGGAMYSFDPAGASDAPGWFKGYGANALYLKNFPAAFKSFDSAILAVSASQTMRRITTPEPPAKDKPPPPPVPEVLKITESLTVPVVNSKISSLSFALGANYLDIDTSATFGYDLEGINNVKYHTIAFREAYTFPLWANESALKLDLDTSSDQSTSLKTNDSKGATVGVTVSPGFSMGFGPQTNSKTSLVTTMQKSFFGNNKLSIKVSPQLSATQFLAPWLLLIGNLNWDYTIETGTDLSQKISKPGASVMLTGMF